MKNLVIVESPAKAKTLGRILGRGYTLKASLGHIRDLPKSALGVEVTDSFVPKYVIPKEKSKVVRELKEAAKSASTIYLATDPDREGEAIAWHLWNVTKANGTPYQRVVFHEITEEAIEQAFKHPRDIDMQLVNAQQARRILDRLVGYKISPLLWRKVRKGLSAGRVQSVALRIVVDREREIERFVPVEYWSIEAELTKKSPAESRTFRATLIGLANGTKLEIHNQTESSQVVKELRRAEYSVSKVETKKVTRQPAPPFITSTLQQEAWRKLHFSAGFTMSIAQQLYEGLPIGEEGNVGLITYMRTDSTNVARSALDETREYIREKYGVKYLPPHPRVFKRTVKGAQEAHEAIRPTKIHCEPRLIKQYLNTAQFRLYELIWQRMIASQMAAAVFDSTTVDVKAASPGSGTDYLLKSTASTVAFPGFITLYSEGKDEVEKEIKEGKLPSLARGDGLRLIDLFAEQRFTQPPPRFTEASLVKMLEQNGIGRPSTYAPTLSTIQEREYVSKSGGGFKPTELGTIVTDLLCQYFPDIVDIQFTAHMEEELDEIAQQKRDWVAVIKEFYTPFEKTLRFATESIRKITLDTPTDELCPEGHPMVIKMGRFGKFLACSRFPEHKFTKPYLVKTGVKCPEPGCGGELVERMSKKKRVFYGCSNYPKCKFATSGKPLPQPCPRCGGLLTLYREKSAKCTKCDYKGLLAEPEPQASAQD